MYEIHYVSLIYIQFFLFFLLLVCTLCDLCVRVALGVGLLEGQCSLLSSKEVSVSEVFPYTRFLTLPTTIGHKFLTSLSNSLDQASLDLRFAPFVLADDFLL